MTYLLVFDNRLAAIEIEPITKFKNAKVDKPPDPQSSLKSLWDSSSFITTNWRPVLDVKLKSNKPLFITWWTKSSVIRGSVVLNSEFITKTIGSVKCNSTECR